VKGGTSEGREGEQREIVWQEGPNGRL